MFTRILQNIDLFQKSFFLLGPRGTGKTQLVKSVFKDAIYIDLLRTKLYSEMLAKPEQLEHMIPEGWNNWIIIDEVQRVPLLLNEVHRLIEEKKYKFILTGSSARKLRKKGTNLLAGRALMYHMYPLTVSELGEKFDLEKSLQYGHLPAVFSEPDPKHYLKTYIEIYLREEVLQEGLTRNIGAFARFLEVASLSQGCILNMASISRECNIHQKVVVSYFDILDDLLIGYRLPIFTKRAKRKVVMHPKFYFFDAGVYRVLRPKGIVDTPAEIDGASLETLFLQELRALNDYLKLDYNLYYWRTTTGLEVDFIVYGEHGFFAFEIKRSTNFDSKDGKGLRAFHEEYPEAKLYLLYGGDTKYYHGAINVVPFKEMLINLKEVITVA